MPLAENTILEDRYRIEALIAQGGMGAVYRAYDSNLDIIVALKENFLQSPDNISQFQREARILARSRHPNLPRVIDHFYDQNRQYLVMDFIAGRDLWQIMQETHYPLPEEEALDYINQVCEAVNYLHQRTPAIIHRDIKPQNIKITPEGEAILVDFGIAKIAEGDGRTHLGARGVTPGYSPPEQYSHVSTSPASDIYALGATLYSLLTAKAPPDSVSLMTGEVAFEPPELSNPMIRPDLSRAIQHAMQLQVADRPQTIRIWQQALLASQAKYAAGQPSAIASTEAPTKLDPSPPPVSLVPPVPIETAAGRDIKGNRRWLWLSVAVIALALVITIGWYQFSVVKIPADSVLNNIADPSSLIGALGTLEGKPWYETHYARQYFEGGLMVWRENPGGENQVWSIPGGGKADSGDHWKWHKDLWVGSAPETPANCPEAQESLPIRYSFAIVWCNSNTMRETLGDPLEEQHSAYDAIYEEFSDGWVISIPIDEKILVLFDNEQHTWQMFEQQ